jgi:hypothetical protein
MADGGAAGRIKQIAARLDRIAEASIAGWRHHPAMGVVCMREHDLRVLR